MAANSIKVSIRSERPNADLNYKSGYDLTEFSISLDNAALMVSAYNKETDQNLAVGDPQSIQHIFHELNNQEINSKRKMHRRDRDFVVGLGADLRHDIDEESQVDPLENIGTCENSPEGALLKKERSELISKTLEEALTFLKNNFSEQQLNTFIRVAVHKVPLKTIANELDISVPAVSKQVKRIRKALSENISLPEVN